MTTSHIRRAIPALALAAALLPAGPAAALEIYTWVDDDGVVHYSESQPEEPAATPVETLRIASTNSPAYDPDDYYWSILNQAGRIGEHWSAIQEAKGEEEAAARAAAAEARIAELERQQAARAATAYVTARPFYGPFAFFPQRHHRVPDRNSHSGPTRDRHPPPRSDRDRTLPDRGPGPGWTSPGSAATPTNPGFAH